MAKPDIEESIEPVDLVALKDVIEKGSGRDEVVSASWLRRVLVELSAARTAEEALGQVFGRRTV